MSWRMSEINTVDVLMRFDSLPTKRRPRFGNGRTYTPARTLHDERRIREQWPEYEDYGAFTGPVGLCLTIMRPLVSGESKSLEGSVGTKKPDIDNVVKCFLDALTGVAWADDRQVVNLNAGYLPRSPKGCDVQAWLHITYYREERCDD